MGTYIFAIVFLFALNVENAQHKDLIHPFIRFMCMNCVPNECNMRRATLRSLVRLHHSHVWHLCELQSCLNEFTSTFAFFYSDKFIIRRRTQPIESRKTK